MSEELSALEESVKEVLTDLRTKKVMSERRMYAGVQESSREGVQDSPLTACEAETSTITTDTRIKHRDDITNAKLISSILPTYLPSRSGTINHDNVTRYFYYAWDMTYLPNGIRAVHANQDKLASLKFSDFNLRDQKSYNMIAPHKYLTMTKGNNLNIIPHPWTQNLAQSSLLNVMKISL
jgi:hypothetical protein